MYEQCIVHYFHLCVEKKCKNPTRKEEKKDLSHFGAGSREELLCWQGRWCAVMVWFSGVFSLYFDPFSPWFLPHFLFLFLSLFLSFPPATSWFTTLPLWVFLGFNFFFPFLPFSSNSSYGSLLSAQTLLFFSLFLTWHFLSKLAHIVSCITPLFMSNDEAFGTFLGGIFVAISSLGSISTLHYSFTFWLNMIVLPSLH